MPTNLYGPNDSFDLEKSHVLQALLRKIYLGKCLEENNWNAIREDLKKNKIERIDEKSSKEKVINVMSDHGVSLNIDKNEVEIEIWGSGIPRREFMYSHDMADACTHIMENINFKDIVNIKSSDSKEVKNTHINIGTGKDISIRDLSNLIKLIIGFKGKFYFNQDKPDGTKLKLTDPSKLHSLGWKHKVELEDGIKSLYDWYLGEKYCE